MTLQERIEDYIGAYADVEALDAWLVLGARRVMMLVPIRYLDRLLTPLSVPGSGLDISTIRLQSVVSNGVTLPEIPARMKTKAQDPRSLYYATIKEPAFYIENGKLFMVPSNASVYTTVFAITFPQVTHRSTTLGVNVEPEVEQAVVLYASIQGRMRQLNNLLAHYVTPLALLTRTMPDAPVAPEFRMQVETASASDAVTVETVLLDLPEFPLPVMGSLALDFTLPDAPSLTPPVPPDYGGVPTLTPRSVPPPASLDLAGELSSLQTAMTQEDVELAQGYVASVRAKLENHVQQHQLWIQSAQVGSEVEKASAELIVTDYRARVEAFSAEINGYMAQIRAGLDYASVRASILQTNVGAVVEKFKGETEGLLGVYRGRIDAYTARVNAAIQKASLEQNRLLENAKLADSASARASQQEAARQVNEYKLSLEKFSGQVQAYAAAVQADSQSLVAQVQKAKVDFDGMTAGLQELKAQFAELMQTLLQRN